MVRKGFKMNYSDMYGLENQLFSWKEWDEMNVMGLVFYDCTLKVPIGDIPVGTTFSSISIDFGHSLMQLYLDYSGENYLEFKLNLSVGEEIKRS